MAAVQGHGHPGVSHNDLREAQNEEKTKMKNKWKKNITKINQNWKMKEKSRKTKKEKKLEKKRKQITKTKCEKDQKMKNLKKNKKMKKIKLKKNKK